MGCELRGQEAGRQDRSPVSWDVAELCGGQMGESNARAVNSSIQTASECGKANKTMIYAQVLFLLPAELT